jgi:hypothetical protein
VFSELCEKQISPQRGLGCVDFDTVHNEVQERGGERERASDIMRAISVEQADCGLSNDRRENDRERKVETETERVEVSRHVA